MARENLFGKTQEELKGIIESLGMPAYSLNQLTRWLYKDHAESVEEMTNLSRQARERLQENYELKLTPPRKAEISSDGTKKYLFLSRNERFIEAAFIPDPSRNTLCLSSQVGCKMGCLFCLTGKQGFQGNLGVDEILNQVRSLPERDQLTNIVFMGMGEPLDNLDAVLKSLEILISDYGYGMSPKRITVSSIGILPALQKFLDSSKCHLAISLHNPFDEERRKLMPVEHIYPIKEVISLLKQYDFTRQRRVSFEYIMFRGLNDTARHVNELARLLNGIKCRINLIRFHPIPSSPLQSSEDADINIFMDKLQQKGIITTLRASRGQDINAACGLLSTKELVRLQQNPETNA